MEYRNMTDLIIIAAVVIAAFGAIMIGWVLAQNIGRSSPEQATDSEEVTPDRKPDRETNPPRPTEAAAPHEAAVAEETPVPEEVRPGAEATPETTPETATPVYVDNRRNEIVVPVNALQLHATEIIATQIERLQAEYIRMDEERQHLAQELLTTLLIEKIEGSAGRLKIETKREAQDLRQQLIKVSADFERAQFRLASLQHLQARLDDPRVARQIDELVKAVKQLAGGR
jgi:hypothetical protein